MHKSDTKKYVAKNTQVLLLFVFIMAISANVIADGGGAYSIYDTDRDGFLDQKEFVKFDESQSKRASSPDFWQFAKVDTDGDQKVSEQEMVNALMEDVKLKRQKK
ncbi:MAG TPA: EF-hand domain-containing protein [Gammaproteobacteria bacterium]